MRRRTYKNASLTFCLGLLTICSITFAQKNDNKKYDIAAIAWPSYHLEQVPLITINSWNEWTETSYIMPCTMYGYGYLETIRRVFGNHITEN